MGLGFSEIYNLFSIGVLNGLYELGFRVPRILGLEFSLVFRAQSGGLPRFVVFSVVGWGLPKP